MNEQLEITTRLWRWTSNKGPAAWHFVTISGVEAEAIAGHQFMQRLEMGRARGFGSVKVRARIGECSWSTSVFPSSSAEGWLLPVKAAIRKAEAIAEGDDVTVRLELV